MGSNRRWVRRRGIVIGLRGSRDRSRPLLTRAFTIPMAIGARPSRSTARALADWLRDEGLDSPWLRWSIDYACRDDYGARADVTSAWAGLLAMPPSDMRSVRRPGRKALVGSRLDCWNASAILSGPDGRAVDRTGHLSVGHDAGHRLVADAVIFAAQGFLLQHHRARTGHARFRVFAVGDGNLWLDRWPNERGLPPAWDNVLFDSPSLSYVVAASIAQDIHPANGMDVLLGARPGLTASESDLALAQDWRTLRDRVLDDLSRAHPDIRDCATRVDICRMGRDDSSHAGIPDISRTAVLVAARDRLFFAHSDLSGVSIFEEAQHAA